MMHLGKARSVNNIWVSMETVTSQEVWKGNAIWVYKRNIMGQLGLYGVLKSELDFGENIHSPLISEIQFECGKKNWAWVEWVKTSFAAFVSAEICVL